MCPTIHCCNFQMLNNCEIFSKSFKSDQGHLIFFQHCLHYMLMNKSIADSHYVLKKSVHVYSNLNFRLLIFITLKPTPASSGIENHCHTDIRSGFKLLGQCKTGRFVTYGEKDNRKRNEISTSQTLDSDRFPDKKGKMCEYFLSIYYRIRHGLTD